MFIQDNVKDVMYFEGETEKKLADISKDENGLLNTSRPNSTYRLMAKHYKGELPAGIYSSLNMQLSKTYNAESLDVRKGKRALRSYRDNIPIPVESRAFVKWNKHEDGNYSFTLYSIPLKTWFGKDLSGNEMIMDMAIAGKYKLGGSSIVFDGKKMFLLAVFQFEKDTYNLDKKKVLKAWLSPEFPIVFTAGASDYTIGDKEEFMHRRIQIQQALRRAQIACRYSKGGKGRKKKLKAIERFKKAEKNYVRTKMHQYSAKLIDWCIKMKCGTLELLDTSSDDEFLLRNWTYHGMLEMIRYKCKKEGIKLIDKNIVDEE
jgi:transposase